MANRWDGLSLFRAALGAWLVLAPWLLPASDGWHRLSGAASGMVLIGVAALAERRSWLRFVQATVGVWTMFSAPLLEPGPIMINSIVFGLVVLVSAFVTREMFTE